MFSLKMSGKSAQLASGVAAGLMQLAAVAFVYWLIKRHLGAEGLGLWGLIFSYASVINLSGFGIGQTMVHFSQPVQGQPHALERHFRVAATITLAGSMIFAGVVFILARAVVVNAAELADPALIDAVLIVILFSFCAAMLHKVVTFTLTGLGFFWVGQIAIFIGAIAYCLATLLLLPQIGLLAAAYGHLAMTVTTLLVSWLGLFVVRFKQTGAFGVLLPFGVYRKELKAMISLGLSFQVTSFLFMFLEPLARTTLAYTGGLSLVGYYEMASRFVLAPRELIAKPATFFSGQFAKQSQNNWEAMKHNYAKSLKQFWLLAGLMLVAIGVAVLPAADYWVQERNSYFFISVLALGIGWSFGVPALIPWNCGIGLGINRYNLNSVLLLVVLNAAFCFMAYSAQSAILVPIGMGCSLVAAQLYLILRFSALLHRNAFQSDLLGSQTLDEISDS